MLTEDIQQMWNEEAAQRHKVIFRGPMARLPELGRSPVTLICFLLPSSLSINHDGLICDRSECCKAKTRHFWCQRRLLELKKNVMIKFNRKSQTLRRYRTEPSLGHIPRKTAPPFF